MTQTILPGLRPSFNAMLGRRRRPDPGGRRDVAARQPVAPGVFMVAVPGRDARQILRQVAETCQDLNSYHFQGAALMERIWRRVPAKIKVG